MLMLFIHNLNANWQPFLVTAYRLYLYYICARFEGIIIMTGKEILKKYREPKNFFNRDLSWIEFNRRVMEEAFHPDLPLLEKVKFISIFFSNLDEFYMIRVSGLKEQIAANILEPTIDGLTPLEQVQKIEKALRPMLKQLDEYWNNEIVPALREHKIFVKKSLSFLPKNKTSCENILRKKFIRC